MFQPLELNYRKWEVQKAGFEDSLGENCFTDPQWIFFHISTTGNRQMSGEWHGLVTVSSCKM
jgi:hypothetical protein